MASLSETRTQIRSWPMWVGYAGDLQRLFRVVQAQYDSLIPLHIEKQLEHPREMLKLAEERHSYIKDEARTYGETPEMLSRLAESETRIKDREEELAEAEAKARSAGNIELSLTAVNGDRTTVQGSAAELLEYIDGARFRSFTASAPTGSLRGSTITISVDRGTGVSLRVSSTNSQWCRAAFAALEAEIEKQVPRWRFIRTFKFLGSFYLLLYVCAYVLLSSFGMKIDITSFVGFGATAVVGIVLGQHAIWSQKLIPAFDLVANNDRPKGIGFMRLFGGIGGSLILAVLGDIVVRAVLG